MRTLTLACLVSLLLAAAAPPRPASARAAPPPVWEVNWGDQYCTLIRRPDPGSNEVVGLRLLPGAEHSSIVLMAPGSTTLPYTVDSVTLGPSARSFGVSAYVEGRAHGAHALVISGLPRSFWDALAGSQELEIKAGHAVRRRIVLVNSAAAVRALRQCASDAFREWGMDEAAWNALKRLPHSTNAMGMSDRDYPTEALRRNGQGRVVVRVTVSAQGRATACTTVATSSTPSMDRATCAAVMSSARFTPALDAQGRPTAAQVTEAVLFLAGG